MANATSERNRLRWANAKKVADRIGVSSKVVHDRWGDLMAAGVANGALGGDQGMLDKARDICLGIDGPMTGGDVPRIANRRQGANGAQTAPQPPAGPDARLRMAMDFIAGFATPDQAVLAVAVAAKALSELTDGAPVAHTNPRAEALSP